MNKLIKVKLLLILLLSFLQFSGQENGLLWRISGKGITKPSYLYGTVHIQDKRVFNFRDSVMACISTADAFATEILMADIKNPEFIKSMMAKDGEHLDQILTKTEYEKVNKKFTEVVGMDLSAFNQMKPFTVSAIMLQTLLAKDMSTSMDEYLSDQAEAKGKKLLAVEKMETQIKVFNSFGKKELMASIDEWDEYEEVLEQMITAYQKEDLKAVNKLTEEGMTEAYIEFEKKLFGDRNITMTESISKMVQSQSTFIAIGAGHLPGDTGVLQRLKNKGYKIELIKSPRTKAAEISNNGLDKGKTYEIKFPTEPTMETQIVDSEIGELKIDIFSYQETTSDVLLFVFGTSTYPEDYRKESYDKDELKAMYDGSVKSSFASMEIEVEKQDNFMFKGIPSRKAKGTLQGFDVEIVYVLKSGVLYMMQTVSKKSDKANAVRKAFVNSLILK